MTGQGHKECRAGTFFHTRDRYASVDGLSRLSRTSDGHSFFSLSCVWSSVSGPPCACLRFSASSRMVVVSPCSLASHIGGVGVRDAAAVAIGQCEGPRRPLGKDKYGGGEPYP